MSDTFVFREKTSHISDGKNILARIYDYSKLEEIPKYALNSPFMATSDIYSIFTVWAETRIEDLSNAKFFHFDGKCEEIVNVRDVTVVPTQIFFDVVTVRQGA